MSMGHTRLTSSISYHVASRCHTISMEWWDSYGISFFHTDYTLSCVNRLLMFLHINNLISHSHSFYPIASVCILLTQQIYQIFSFINLHYRIVCSAAKFASQQIVSIRSTPWGHESQVAWFTYEQGSYKPYSTDLKRFVYHIQYHYFEKVAHQTRAADYTLFNNVSSRSVAVCRCSCYICNHWRSSFSADRFQVET